MYRKKQLAIYSFPHWDNIDNKYVSTMRGKKKKKKEWKPRPRSLQFNKNILVVIEQLIILNMQVILASDLLYVPWLWTTWQQIYFLPTHEFFYNIEQTDGMQALLHRWWKCTAKCCDCWKIVFVAENFLNSLTVLFVSAIVSIVINRRHFFQSDPRIKCVKCCDNKKTAQILQ